MENKLMTPWTIVNTELRSLKKDWPWLAESLELKIQAVNHWQARGIPAKHHSSIENLLGKPRGWGDIAPQSRVNHRLFDLRQKPLPDPPAMSVFFFALILPFGIN